MFQELNHLNNLYIVFREIHVSVLLEHLEKDQSLKLVELMKKRVKQVLLIQTPDGFVYNFQDSGPQKHRCGFSQGELEKLGFEVTRLKNAKIGSKKLYDQHKRPYPLSWDYLTAAWRP